MSHQDRSIRKLQVFWRFTKELAELSTCKRRHVGCVIVPPTFEEVLAIGYSGPACGEPNDACRDIPAACGCIHAEANAIAKLTTTRDGLLLLTTTAPCPLCAGLIINTKRIKVVRYLDEYDTNRSGVQRLRKAGVHVLHESLEPEFMELCHCCGMRFLVDPNTEENLVYTDNCLKPQCPNCGVVKR